MTTKQLQAVCNSLSEATLRTTLTELTLLRDSGPAYPEYGICNAVTSPTEGILRSLGYHWPKFSGNLDYPVPHPTMSPYGAYDHVSNLWGTRSELNPDDPDDRYRLNRWELLDWMIDTISKHLQPAPTHTKTIAELRAQGFVVVVFSPEEMRGMRPKDLESFLVKMGNEAIEEHPDD